MKLARSKKEQRQELDALMRDYLEHGGAINEVARGISGRLDNRQALPHVFDKKAEPDTRTPVSDEIAAIEERRKPKPAARATSPKKLNRARKKIIYDEFGEALRWEWES
ncbi:hypothetical protein [Gilvimarinus polysaccharolyticus]|uniref:hypothetical protein n=1 Tax=Gilvimarinus polysaccharolyticus TaxID=863921 RepID=UPI000673837B|nr:hypothetical protein [Gilvimarinus polysaccharolyticus]